LVHKHSEAKLQERKARAYIFSTAFMDRIQCETVCKVNRVDVLAILQEPVIVSSVPQVEHGEVLLDSRGTGSFQERVLPE